MELEHVDLEGSMQGCRTRSHVGVEVPCRAVGWGAPMVCRALGRSTCVGAYSRAVVGRELSLNLEGVLFTVLPGKEQSL